GVMTLVGRRTDDGWARGTDAGLTAVVLGAGVVVDIAAGHVRLRRVRTDTSRCIAGAGVMTLIGRRTDDGWARGTDAGLTAVVLGACVVVGIAAGIVHLRRVRSVPTRRTSDLGVMTLVGRRTDDGWARGTDAGLTAVVLGA